MKNILILILSLAPLALTAQPPVAPALAIDQPAVYESVRDALSNYVATMLVVGSDQPEKQRANRYYRLFYHENEVWVEDLFTETSNHPAVTPERLFDLKLSQALNCEFKDVAFTFWGRILLIKFDKVNFFCDTPVPFNVEQLAGDPKLKPFFNRDFFTANPSLAQDYYYVRTGLVPQKFQGENAQGESTEAEERIMIHWIFKPADPQKLHFSDFKIIAWNTYSEHGFQKKLGGYQQKYWKTKGEKAELKPAEVQSIRDSLISLAQSWQTALPGLIERPEEAAAVASQYFTAPAKMHDLFGEKPARLTPKAFMGSLGERAVDSLVFGPVRPTGRAFELPDKKGYEAWVETSVQGRFQSDSVTLCRLVEPAPLLIRVVFQKHRKQFIQFKIADISFAKGYMPPKNLHCQSLLPPDTSTTGRFPAGRPAPDRFQIVFQEKAPMHVRTFLLHASRMVRGAPVDTSELFDLFERRGRGRIEVISCTTGKIKTDRLGAYQDHLDDLPYATKYLVPDATACRVVQQPVSTGIPGQWRGVVEFGHYFRGFGPGSEPCTPTGPSNA